ncbi:MAG: hypothetical protein ACYC1D_00785 [Acidimicrobiales bacterium]
MTDHHRSDTPHIDDLPGALRRQAAGALSAEVAAEVLIGHRAWLARDDFVAPYVEVLPAPGDGAPMAVIDWEAALAAIDAGRLVCSSSEAQVLRIAASLAVGVPVELSSVLTGLDDRNLTIVGRALTHAGGRPALGCDPHDPSRPRPPSRNDGVTITCPVCATPVTPAGRRRYCSDACRQAGHRLRHSGPPDLPKLPPSQPRRPVTVYACGSCDNRRLGEQYCADCATFMHKIGTGGCCPACDEPVAYEELTGE